MTALMSFIVDNPKCGTASARWDTLHILKISHQSIDLMNSHCPRKGLLGGTIGAQLHQSLMPYPGLETFEKGQSRKDPMTDDGREETMVLVHWLCFWNPACIDGYIHPESRIVMEI